MKRGISVFCACAISTLSILGSLPFNLKIDSNKVKQVNNVSVSLNKDVEHVGDIKDSYIEESDIKFNSSSSSVKKDKYVSKALRLSEYTPTLYTDRTYASIPKHQGQLSTCWGFSTIAAIESNLIKKGIADRSIDLSEAGLVYFTFNKPSNSTKDTVKYTGSQSYLDRGGNRTMTMYALASGTCLVDEAELPYSGLNAYTKYDESYGYDSDYIVRDVGIIKANNKEGIKEAVYTYGAVSASLNHIDSNTYYNSQNSAYYQNVETLPNHAVTIIGWDDNYSRDKFNLKPNSNGAWLVKNSWGTTWGDGGYYWVSYEDTSLNNEMWDVAYFNMEKKNNDFLNIYEHDGTYNTTWGWARYQSNVFTSKEDEALTDVLFYTYEDNISYELSIYTGVKENPSDGELAITQTGQISQAGCHTIKLDKAVNVKKGTKYSAVIKLSKANGETTAACFDTTSYGHDMEHIVVAEKGESFYKLDGGSWVDTAEAHGENCRIKVYTQHAEVSNDSRENNETICKCVSLELVKGKEATCIEDGIEDYYTCTGCNKKYEDAYGNKEIQEPVKINKRHYMTFVQEKKVTCTEDGTKAYFMCSKCNKKYEDVYGNKELKDADVIIKSANGVHKEVVIPGYEATCCSSGLTDGKKCSECGAILEAQKIIEKTNHVLLYIPGEEATYVNDGHRAYYECYLCRGMYSDAYGYVETNYNLIRINKLQVGAPNSIKAKTRKSSSITVTWSKVSGASGYAVFVAKNGKWVQLATTTGTSYTAKNLSAGTNYTYAVMAYKNVNGKAVWSNSYKQATLQTLLGKTSKISSKSAGKGKVTLSWNKVKGASGYRLYYKQGKKWVTLKSSMSGNKIKVTGLNAGKKYTFAVKAYAKENGKTVWSDVYTSKTVTAPKK